MTRMTLWSAMTSGVSNFAIRAGPFSVEVRGVGIRKIPFYTRRPEFSKLRFVLPGKNFDVSKMTPEDSRQELRRIFALRIQMIFPANRAHARPFLRMHQDRPLAPLAIQLHQSDMA